MKLLATASEIEHELSRLLARKDTRLNWAVAWASTGFPAFDGLVKNRSKIDRLTVGLHFYQTHPNFIQDFRDHEGVRFRMETSGVFHPKIYLFTHSDGTWDCILGSANFTAGGLRKNVEACLLIGSGDVDAEIVHEQLIQLLDDYWQASDNFTEKMESAYRAMWARKAPALNRLAGVFGTPRGSEQGDGGLEPINSEVLLKSWDNFVGEIRLANEQGLEERLEILRSSREWFTKYPSFEDIPVRARKIIAGIIPESEWEPGDPNWWWFGHMGGAGNFKNLVIEKPASLSAALARIPMSGPITRDQYFEFVKLFQLAFEGKQGGGDSAVATPTRLLAMKRPDYFVCLDSKNKDALCAEFEISRTLNFEKYWNSLCERIYDSAWWNADMPVDSFEREIWLGRAALLDVLFYDRSL